jgi:hypothetical protein
VQIDARDTCRAIRLVASCIASTPRTVSLDSIAVGKTMDAMVTTRIEEVCAHVLRPLETLADPAWRREMVPVLVRRTFRAVGLG